MRKLLLAALLATACTSSSSPVAPSASGPDPAAPATPTVTIVVETRSPGVRLRATGLHGATDIQIQLDWEGEVRYEGFSRGLWWFVDEHHWEYVFMLDRTYRGMSFEVWRGQPIDGDGLLGVIRFRNNNHLPLRGARVWVDGVEAQTVIVARGENDAGADSDDIRLLAEPNPATRDRR